MFSRKKAEPPKARKRNHNLSQFGLTDIPDDFDPSAGYGDDDENDSDLEAELAAITGGVGKPKPKAKPKATLMPDSDLDKMIADSMKDIGSDEDDDDAENDPDLLGELSNIAGNNEDIDEMQDTMEVETNEKSAEPQQIFLPTTTTDTASILKTRIEMYTQAEAVAKSSGEGAKARRFGRGLKTLNDLLKQVSAGKTINIDDIPPEVSVKPKVTSDESTPTHESTSSEKPLLPNVPSRTAPAPPPSVPSSPLSKPTTPNESNDITSTSEQTNEKSKVLNQMRSRQNEYKTAALQSKRSGDTAMALQYIKVVKQFDLVMKMYEDGQEVDLSDMPPPPEQFKQFLEQMQSQSGAEENGSKEEQTQVPTTIPTPAPTPTPTVPIAKENNDSEEQSGSEATTVLEALQQRLNKYKSVEESAKAEGNSSKARRFGRIVKQYEDAIKSYKAGRPVAYDELPVPPGFGPLPTENAAAQKTTQPTLPIESNPSTGSGPVTPTKSNDSPTKDDTKTSPSTPTAKQDLTTRTSGNQQKNNLAEQQMRILLDRQKEFKLAAIEAKKAGEIDQAKEYLKIFKGFDSLLNAASSGLPVDLSSLPLPPSQRDNLEASFAIVTTDDCDPDDDISDIGVRIEEQLAKQLMMCKNTRDHHKAMGDVAGMNRFENLAVTVQKDLDLVRYSKRKNFPLPKFHYEKRSFNIVHCNTDLTDNELEIVLIRGLNFNVTNPKDVDTYVKIEFPLLNEETFRTKTTLIKDTDSPDYDQRFKVEIQRGNRQFQRIFKRHGVKFEVYSRGGFLRSDILIGTVNVKLQPLETKCEIHDTFDLMEGRKTVRGKLELKLRVRNPILTKQVEHLNEKWLVLDS